MRVTRVSTAAAPGNVALALGARWATTAVTVLLSLLVGYTIAAGGLWGYVAVASAALFALLVHLTGVARLRELVLWLLLFVAVLNFLPALFTPTDLNEQPFLQRAVRDAAIVPLLVAAALISTRRDRQDAGLTRLLSALRVVLWSLAVLMLVDLIARETPVLSFLVSFRYFVFYPLIALVVWRLSLSGHEIGRLLTGIAVLGAVEAGIALLDFANLIGQTYYDSGSSQFLGFGVSRAIGTLGNPNNLGLFLGLPAFLLIAGAVFRSWKLRAPLLVFVLLGVLASLSKTAVLALGLAIVVQQAIDRTPTRIRLVVPLGLVVLVAYVSFALRLGSDLSSQALLGSRAETVPEALSQLLSQPAVLLFGHGYGSQLGPEGPNQVGTDSMVFAVALEGGIVGLIIFAAMVSIATAIVIRVHRRRPTAVISALSGYCTFFLFYSLVAGNFRLFPGALLFWMAVGLAATLGLRPMEVRR